MKQPVSRPRALPREAERSARLEPFGHDEPRRGARRRNDVLALIPAAVYVEIEPMQMHRVRGASCIDDAHANGIANAIGQSLGVRPRPSVDHHSPRAIAARVRIAPDTHQQDAVLVRGPLAGVDDHRACQL